MNEPKGKNVSFPFESRMVNNKELHPIFLLTPAHLCYLHHWIYFYFRYDSDPCFHTYRYLIAIDMLLLHCVTRGRLQS